MESTSSFGTSLPENLYSVESITTCDLTGEARKTDFGLIYPSMIDRMETDPTCPRRWSTAFGPGRSINSTISPLIRTNSTTWPESPEHSQKGQAVQSRSSGSMDERAGGRRPSGTRKACRSSSTKAMSFLTRKKGRRRARVFHKSKRFRK